MTAPDITARTVSRVTIAPVVVSELTPDLRTVWARKLTRLIPRGAAVVELGCGNGVPVAWILSDRYAYRGIDASSEQIQEAIHAVPSAAFICADPHEVTMRSGAWNAVISFFALAEVGRDGWPSLLGSIRSWLVPDGVFVAAVPMLDPDADVTVPDLLDDAGFEVLESAIVTHRDSEGELLRASWFIAQRR